VANKTKDQMWADWVATQSVDHFQERLNAATEDGKYKILAQVLSRELGNLKKERQHWNFIPLHISRSVSQHQQSPKWGYCGGITQPTPLRLPSR
jgi:hypothetical protein